MEEIPDYIESLKQAQAREEQEAQGVYKEKRKRRKVKNSGVLVSGLPEDATVEEVGDFMAKWGGVIKKKATTRERLVKLLGGGQARVIYFRPESVQQVINLADGMEFRDGHEVRIEPAEFKKKKGKKGARQDKRLKLYDQEEAELGWDEDAPKKHVIIEGLFTLQESTADDPVQYFMELKEELMDEFGKFGAVKNLKIFEHNPDGVVAVKYEEAEAAAQCVAVMEGRYFDKRRLKAHFYDGFTDYAVQETEEARQKRIEKFGEWLGESKEAR